MEPAKVFASMLTGKAFTRTTVVLVHNCYIIICVNCYIIRCSFPLAHNDI